VRNLSVATISVLWLTFLGGCSPEGQTKYSGFQDEDPAKRIEAIVRAGQARDAAAMPYIVDRLTDSQADVRFYAYLALKRITGKDMGSHYYDTPAKRAVAASQWRSWLKQSLQKSHQGSSSKAEQQGSK